MIEALRSQALDAFARQFPSQSPSVMGIAPGRVELLGNHTDYNLGLVLAAAVDRYTCVVAAPNGSDRIQVWSENLGALETIGRVGTLEKGPTHSWTNYVRGVVACLNDSGVPVEGFSAAIVGNVPLGSGMSSSASLECAVAMAVLGLFGSGTSSETAGMPLVNLMRRAEDEFAGVHCGVLDHFSSLFGKAGHGLYLDCDTLAHEVVPLGNNAPAIVVCDSRAPRQLSSGKYNERRAECTEAVGTYNTSVAAHRFLRQLCGPTPPTVVQMTEPVRSLREISMEAFLHGQRWFEPRLARRVRHVLTENQRVAQGLELLRQSGDVGAFGQLMLASHRSSRDDFENSSTELELLMEIAECQPGFIGGKLCGAGWGGCTVNLVEPSSAEAFGQAITKHYKEIGGSEASVWICHAADGAHYISL